MSYFVKCVSVITNKFYTSKNSSFALKKDHKTILLNLKKKVDAGVTRKQLNNYLKDTGLW